MERRAVSPVRSSHSLGSAWPAGDRLGCSFFFSSRRRHTSSIGDWSSDVCSSDLLAILTALASRKSSERDQVREVRRATRRKCGENRESRWSVYQAIERRHFFKRRLRTHGDQSGRASCRERV